MILPPSWPYNRPAVRPGRYRHWAPPPSSGHLSDSRQRPKPESLWEPPAWSRPGGECCWTHSRPPGWHRAWPGWTAKSGISGPDDRPPPPLQPPKPPPKPQHHQSISGHLSLPLKFDLPIRRLLSTAPSWCPDAPSPRCFCRCALVPMPGSSARAEDAPKAQKAPEHKTTQSESYIMVDPIYTTIVADNRPPEC